MLRWIIRALAIVVIAVAAFVVLDFAELLVPVGAGRHRVHGDTIPACDGRVLAQGLTYRLFDPSPQQSRRGARRRDGRRRDRPRPRRRRPHARAARRGRPGRRDRRPRGGSVFVNDVKFDDITTAPFGPVTVPNEQYFLLGDNRSAAIDSRTFGPVLGNAIFARGLRRLLAASRHHVPARAGLRAHRAGQDRLRRFLRPEVGRL